jgi:hypothetical protein
MLNIQGTHTPLQMLRNCYTRKINNATYFCQEISLTKIGIMDYFC